MSSSLTRNTNRTGWSQKAQPGTQYQSGSSTMPAPVSDSNQHEPHYQPVDVDQYQQWIKHPRQSPHVKRSSSNQQVEPMFKKTKLAKLEDLKHQDSEQAMDICFYACCMAIFLAAFLITVYIFINGGLPWFNDQDDECGVEIMDYGPKEDRPMRPVQVSLEDMKQRKIWCSVGCSVLGFALKDIKPGYCDYLVYSFYSLTTGEQPTYTCQDHGAKKGVNIDEQFKQYNGTEVKLLEFGHFSPEHTSVYQDSCEKSMCNNLPDLLRRENFQGAVLSFEYLSIPEDVHKELLTLWTTFASLMRNNSFQYAVYSYVQMESCDYKKTADFLLDDRSLGLIMTLHLMNDREHLSPEKSDAVCPQPYRLHSTHRHSLTLDKMLNTMVLGMTENIWEQHQKRIALTITFKFIVCRLESADQLQCTPASWMLKAYRTVCYDVLVLGNGTTTYDPTTDCGVLQANTLWASGLLNTFGTFWKQPTYGAFNIFLVNIEDDDQDGLCSDIRLLEQFGKTFKTL